MVTKSSLMLLTAVATAMATAGVANATIVAGTATLTEGSAPSGTVIASNLPGSGITASSGNTLNYYTNSYGAVPGQTFTTGSSSYSLTQIALYVADAGNGSADAGHLVIGTVGTGNSYTLTNQYTGTIPTLTSGGYLDITLGTPLSLAANTTYIYGFYDDNSNYAGPGLVTTGGAAGMQLATLGGGFGSGTANPNATGSFSTYSGANGAATIATGSTGTDNAAFEVLGTTSTVPEPASIGLVSLGVLGILLMPRRRRTA